MEKSNSESKSSVSEIDCDFNELSQKLFPHDIGFPKDLSSHSNNYFNATFHCLTNLYDLTSPIIDGCNTGQKNNPYIDLLNKIIVLKDKPFSKQEERKIINSFLGDLKSYISQVLKYNEKDNEDPRKLIPIILKDLENNNMLPEFILIKLEKFCTICNTVTKLDELKCSSDINTIYVKFDIPRILEYTHKKKIEVFTISDCFQYYFESIMKIEKSFECSQCHKETNQKIRIKELPNILLIFLYYDENNKNCHFENSAYKFEENIDFKKFNFLSEDDRKKKYFLYSLIACKNIGTDFELFYTFSRANENSKYFIYNGCDIRKELKIRNKMEKDKIDFRDKKQSWPFVLVYKNIQP